jgi:hypothetical protein
MRVKITIGGNTAASCRLRANRLEPYAYLKRLFTDLPKATTVEDFEALLPFNTAPAQ